MKRIALSTAVFLGGMALAASAQTLTATSGDTTYKSTWTIAQPPYTLTVQEVISVVEVSGYADTNRATVRLSSGATVAVDIWAPFNPPMFTPRKYVQPITGAMLVGALKMMKSNSNPVQLPIQLKGLWKSRWSTIYEAYWETELTLFVPVPADYTGNSESGGLMEARIADHENCLVPGTSLVSYGYLRLQEDDGTMRYFYILRRDPAKMLNPIAVWEAEDLADTIFDSPFWIQFYGTVKPTTDSAIRVVVKGTGW